MKTELSDEQILELARQEADEDELGFIFNKDGRWSVLSFARAVLAARSALPADRLHAAGWKALTDREWVNIVNAPEVLREQDAGNPDIAVNVAVRLTEAKCREKNCKENSQ